MPYLQWVSQNPLHPCKEIKNLKKDLKSHTHDSVNVNLTESKIKENYFTYEKFCPVFFFFYLTSLTILYICLYLAYERDLNIEFHQKIDLDYCSHYCNGFLLDLEIHTRMK